MKADVAFLFGVLFAFYVAEISALTNSEFFNLVRPYITDLEIDEREYSNNENDNGNELEANDIITLPGGPDDEVDFEYLIQKLDLEEELQDLMDGTETKTTDTSQKGVGWFWKRRRRHNTRRRKKRGGLCHCKTDECSCCITHTFRVNLWIKRFTFRFHGCVAVGFYPKRNTFEISITFNGRRLFHHVIRLNRPPRLCFGIPPLSLIVRACVELYNINLRQKSACIRLVGEIDLKIKTFRIHLNIACFRIPLMVTNATQNLIYLSHDSQPLAIEYLPVMFNETTAENDFSETIMMSVESNDVWNDQQEVLKFQTD